MQNVVLGNLLSMQKSNQPVFGGGKFTNFSKQLSPNLSIAIPSDLDIGYLKFIKMLPRLNQHYSGVTSNYLYVYLDPYKPAETIDDYHYKIPPGVIGSKDLYFGYEPIYIGKGVSSTGHRLNQHVADFLALDDDLVGDSRVKNIQKMERLKEIANKFGKPEAEATMILPKNWNDYKKEWVCILFSFPDRLSLEVAEKILIQTIGSVNGIKRGPLTNISMTR